MSPDHPSRKTVRCALNPCTFLGGRECARPTVTTPVNTSGFGLFLAPEEDVLEAATASDDKEFQDYSWRLASRRTTTRLSGGRRIRRGSPPSSPWLRASWAAQPPQRSWSACSQRLENCTTTSASARWMSRWSSNCLPRSTGSARVAFSERSAVAAHDASTHLTEWDEPVAVETRGGAEAYMETLCDVLGLGCQWADFARRTCV